MTVQSASIHDPGKRARLIESAAALFSRVGFERAGVDEIASKADVAKGTVYLYFESKADLFHAVLAELRKRIEEEAARAAGHEPSVALRRQIRTQLAVADTAPDLFRCYTSALFGVNRDFQATALAIFDGQKNQVARALRRMPGTARATRSIDRRASLFVGAILATALVRGLEGGRSRAARQDEHLLMALVTEPLR